MRDAAFWKISMGSSMASNVLNLRLPFMDGATPYI